MFALRLRKKEGNDVLAIVLIQQLMCFFSVFIFLLQTFVPSPSKRGGLHATRRQRHGLQLFFIIFG